MSLRTLPLLFINLGGEMLYILDQRLQAQNIAVDKAKKADWTGEDRKRVMNDIVTTMFNRKFMEELLKPQEVYSNKALRTVFERLAHSSIMRLNHASMDKLYDLMIMAFKYQVLLCPRPRDLLLVSFNHLDAVKNFVKDVPAIFNQVEETHRLLIEMYVPLSAGEFQLIRQTLLLFFQDLHIRVSLFLKDKVQNSNGRFALPVTGPVPYGVEVPGVIRIFGPQGKEVKRTPFPPVGTYSSAVREGSFDVFGDRATVLGTNMYCVSRPVETHLLAKSKASSQHAKNAAPNPLAKEELNLLSRLMGRLDVQSPAHSGFRFRVNLFSTDEEEEEAFLSRPDNLSYEVINIRAIQDQQANGELARIMGEFQEEAEPSQQPGSKGEELLAMMDGL
ncbi:protein OSCP1a isoform X2 [Anguilla rostrata]|uniref:protein OSCP1a isoform X2 n=1 Tax=Anguilla rostrata TaxID=7938 RepID=UPI0030D1E45D